MSQQDLTAQPCFYLRTLYTTCSATSISTSFLHTHTCPLYTPLEIPNIPSSYQTWYENYLSNSLQNSINSPNSCPNPQTFFRITNSLCPQCKSLPHPPAQAPNHPDEKAKAQLISEFEDAIRTQSQSPITTSLRKTWELNLSNEVSNFGQNVRPSSLTEMDDGVFFIPGSSAAWQAMPILSSEENFFPGFKPEMVCVLPVFSLERLFKGCRERVVHLGDFEEKEVEIGDEVIEENEDGDGDELRVTYAKFSLFKLVCASSFAQNGKVDMNFGADGQELNFA